MRVATYNIHDCIGMDKRFDPARVAQVLREIDADILALQEVTLDLGGELAEQFEIATGLHAVDGTVVERGVGRYGNLLLLKQPPEQTQLHDISVKGREERGIVEAQIQIDNGPLRVFGAHLGLRSHERRWQLDRLAEMIKADDVVTTLLLGDFNIWGWSRLLTRLTDVGFENTPIRSFPTKPCPIVPVDRILVRSPASITRCWRHDTPTSRVASDHFPVVAEIDFAD